jgi:hypothetical protein
MKPLWIFALSLVLGVLWLPETSRAQVGVLDPSGKYLVSTVDDDGSPLQGTLTITSSSGGYTGQFEASALPQPVPVVAVTTNADRVLIIVNTAQGLALVNMQQQKDGTFKGTWHRLNDGIALTATKGK